jgi:hypothetical protein
MKISNLIPNTVKPAYNGTAAAGEFRFKQALEFFILGIVKFFR